MSGDCPSSSCIPQTEVKTVFDVGKWKTSIAFREFLQFLHAVNKSIVGMKTSSQVVQSPIIDRLLNMLDTVKEWTELFPPEDMDSQRFGNKSYRKWFEQLEKEGKGLLDKVLEAEQSEITNELFEYLKDSFGNCTRIDYGTGHEATFLILLLCIHKLGLLPEETFPAVGLRVVGEYLRVCRYLQVTYHMEPAGSRGVHALDDFQFVPFLWGSSQLVGTPFLPDHYPLPDKVSPNKDLSLFLEAVDYINHTKTGPFHEHSNQLWNISAVPNWDKVNSGLFKMYEAEVLLKFPVVQHFKFGSLFKIEKAPPVPPKE